VLLNAVCECCFGGILAVIKAGSYLGLEIPLFSILIQYLLLLVMHEIGGDISSDSQAQLFLEVFCFDFLVAGKFQT